MLGLRSSLLLAKRAKKQPRALSARTSRRPKRCVLAAFADFWAAVRDDNGVTCVQWEAASAGAASSMPRGARARLGWGPRVLWVRRAVGPAACRARPCSERKMAASCLSIMWGRVRHERERERDPGSAAGEGGRARPPRVPGGRVHKPAEPTHFICLTMVLLPDSPAPGKRGPT